MKYLKNNDIIIILVIFLLFCLYLFKDRLEGFQGVTSMVDPVLRKKQERKDLLFSLIENLEFSLNKIQDINIISKEIIKILFQNKYNYKEVYSGDDKSGVQSLLIKLYETYLELSNTIVVEVVDKKNLTELINKFKETNNDILYKNYIELFEKVNSNVSSNRINICPNGIVLEPQQSIFNFFTNLKNSANVIASSNPLSINLIEQNVKQIISELSLVNLKTNTRDEIYGLLNEYTDLLEVVFNNRINFDVIFILQNVVDCDSKTTEELVRNHDSYIQHLNYVDFQISNINGTLKNVLDFFEGEVSDIFIEEDEQNFFEISKKNMELEQKFCDKLSKLDKPKKNNLVFKRFSEEVINKKKKYIEDLNKQIESIYEQMTENEINEYNLNRIRIDDQAGKQYRAIKKGISNIKNKNKIKINLY